MPDHNAPPDPLPQLSLATDSVKRVVLVVDDEPDVVEELTFTFESAGLAVRAAHSVTEAEALLATHDDVLAVLTDIRMPGASGLALAQRLLAARGDEDAIELVLMTGHATVEDAAAAVRAGAFDFLQKPFSIREAVERVTAAADRAAARREGAARSEAERRRLRAAEAAVEALRFHDPLTGLLNRDALQLHLDGPSVTGPGERPDMVIVLEVRRFAGIGEIVGDGGDESVLRAIAARLRDAVADEALIARHEGGVFAVAIPHLGAAASEAAATALLCALEEPLHVGSRDLSLGFNLGVAHRDHVGCADLLLAAEAAGRAAGQRGGRGIVAFEPEIHRGIVRRLALEHDLPGAAARGELTAVFQPIVSMSERHLVGFEALLRWQHPHFGNISPVECIPIAEETGSIGILGAWMLGESLRRAAAWRRLVGDRAPRLSVNVSPVQFAAGGMVEGIADALANSGLPPCAIGVELTESGLVQDGIVASLSGLRERGIRVAIDDFGTGYSSLSWLRDLPSDVVKLDRSFVLSLERSEADQAFVGAVVNLAKLSGRMTLAEGVETEEQFTALRRFGCDYAQGYLFGKPIDAASADALVAQAVPDGLALPLPG